jgi:hypothetical protein
LFAVAAAALAGRDPGSIGPRRSHRAASAPARAGRRRDSERDHRDRHAPAPSRTAPSSWRDGKNRRRRTKRPDSSGAETSSTARANSSRAGIIDAHSHIANDAINEGAHGGELDGRHGRRARSDRHRHLARSRRRHDGANILHGSANPIGGKTLVIKLRWAEEAPSDLVFGALPGIKFALGENAKRPRRSAPAAPRYPTTRQGVEYVMRDAFTRAKAYQKPWQDYEKARRGQDVLPPDAISSSTRSSKSSKASASCTCTATAPTKS